jgi:hypothetical protein
VDVAGIKLEDAKAGVELLQESISVNAMTFAPQSFLGDFREYCRTS